MRFIKANKVLVIVIGIAILFIVVIGLLATQTGEFDSDDELINDIQKIQNEDKNKGDSKGEMSRVVKPAPEIEAIVDNPGGRETIEEGTPEEIDAKRLWEANNLLENEGDSSKYRDMKRELRITSYEDYKELKSKVSKEIERPGIINLGEPGLEEKPSEVLYKNNDIVDFGDIRVVGAEADDMLIGVKLDIQNNSGEIIDANELINQIEVKFKVEGEDTKYISMKDFEKPFSDIEDFNKGSSEVDSYIGRGLTKKLQFRSRDAVIFKLYGKDLISEDEVSDYYASSFGVRNEEHYEPVKRLQEGMPEAITITIKYNKQEEEYTLLKSEDILIYRELQQ